MKGASSRIMKKFPSVAHFSSAVPWRSASRRSSSARSSTRPARPAPSPGATPRGRIDQRRLARTARLQGNRAARVAEGDQEHLRIGRAPSARSMKSGIVSVGGAEDLPIDPLTSSTTPRPPVGRPRCHGSRERVTRRARLPVAADSTSTPARSSTARPSSPPRAPGIVSPSPHRDDAHPGTSTVTLPSAKQINPRSFARSARLNRRR